VQVEAALLICASTALFGIGDAIVKELTQHWSVAQILLVRGLIALPMILLLRQGTEPLWPRHVGDPLNLARAGCEIGVSFGFFLGVRHLPLGDAVCIMFTAPILLTAAAAVILRERVGWRRWTAVVLGFVGVLIVMRPGGELWTPAALLPFLAACFIAARDIIVRRLDPRVSNRSVVTASTLALLLTGAVTSPLTWAPAGWGLVAGAAACAVTVTTAFVCYVRATRIAEVSFIQPIKYLAIPYAFLLGWLIWGDVPDATALAGAVLIVASGLFILERRRRVERG
jgi:drug/metabolite transporter (DMT)-like permease